MRSLNLRLLALATLAGTILTRPAAAQVDTLPRGELFGWGDLTIVGGFAVLTVATAPLDKRLARMLQDSSRQESRRLSRAARIVRTATDPGTIILGGSLYAYGRIAKDERAADLGLHATEALVFGEALGLVLKGLAGRARPYNDIDNPRDYQLLRGFRRGNSAYRSMPSGHTIAAFAVASAVTSETSRWWPRSTWFVAPAIYGGAAAVGVSRMYNNQHWASDVVTGAAIGTMAGVMVVRWHHMNPGNAIDRVFLGASVRSTPTGRTVSLLALPILK